MRYENAVRFRFMNACRACVVAVLSLIASLSVAENKKQETKSLIDRAKELSDIRTDHSPSFRMKIAFKVIDHLKETDGTYVETWASPEKWRREIISGDFRRLMVANGNKIWTSTTTPSAPSGTAELGFRMNLRLFSPESWINGIKERKIDLVTVRCLESKRDYMGKKSALCFDKSTGLIAQGITSVPNDSTVMICAYGGYEKFGDRTFPRTMRCSESGHPVFESTLIELTTEISPEATLFAPLAGAVESVNCRGAIQNAPKAIYTPDPVPSARDFAPNIVVLSLTIGADGVPQGLKVTRSLDPAFGEAAINAVRNWRFQPATCDGQPIATQATVEVAFHR